MTRYIKRLERCGYSTAKARSLCMEFVRNLSISELDYFIQTMEESHGIRLLEPEPC